VLAFLHIVGVFSVDFSDLEVPGDMETVMVRHFTQNTYKLFSWGLVLGSKVAQAMKERLIVGVILSLLLKSWIHLLVLAVEERNTFSIFLLGKVDLHLGNGASQTVALGLGKRLNEGFWLLRNLIKVSFLKHSLLSRLCKDSKVILDKLFLVVGLLGTNQFVIHQHAALVQDGIVDVRLPLSLRPARLTGLLGDGLQVLLLLYQKFDVLAGLFRIIDQFGTFLCKCIWDCGFLKFLDFMRLYQLIKYRLNDNRLRWTIYRERLLIIKVRHDVMLFHVVQIKSLQEDYQTLVSLFKLIEELLSMRSSLCRGPCLHMGLNVLPLLTVQLQRLQEAEVFIFCPATHLEDSVVRLLCLLLLCRLYFCFLSFLGRVINLVFLELFLEESW
jgi:hypothetical protein